MVQGLTTFIHKRSHLYMDKYQLHNSEVILDGASLSHMLFCRNLNPKNCCFNGDYDRYAYLVRSVLTALLDCNITPYIYYDGGYEDKRLTKNLTRMQERIKKAVKLDPASKDIIFPLCLGETLKDVAEELDIKVICCNYESDLEAAKIANNLKCPVMSYDSDFFIFDVDYIPFNTVKWHPMTSLRTINNEKHVYKYIACEIFNKQKFLNDTNLENDKLALFAVLLGNDYIHREVFDKLYRKYKRPGPYDPLTIIKSFLNNKTEETALQEISSTCNFSDETQMKKINNSINSYKINKEENSKYLKYLKLENSGFELEQPLNNNEINKFIKMSGVSQEMLNLFIDNFRMCLYPPYFMTILFFDMYHVRPQVEDISMPSVHLINLDIISAIHKILKPASKECSFYTRSGCEHKKHLVPLCTIPLPSYIEIQNIDTNSRQKILLEILNCSKNFVDTCLNLFPNSWKLYIIAIKYLCDKTSDTTWSFVYALLLCKIVIEYIDSKIKTKVTCIRDPELFVKTFNDDISQILINKSDRPNLKPTLHDAISDITYNDSVLAMKSLINFFQVKPEIIENCDLFERTLVHFIGQFQSCLYHIKSLNSLLNLPFENCPLMNCFNGTFLYNLTNELRQQSTDYYIQDLLQESPTILNCFNIMVKNLEEHIDIIF